MAVTFNNDSFIFDGEIRARKSSPKATPTPIDYFADGAEIRKVANGFMVMPPRRDCEYASDLDQTHVFSDSTEMATWLRKRFAVKAT